VYLFEHWRPHWVIWREYGCIGYGKGRHSSPREAEAGIYAEAERRFELDPRTTVFIDDRAENLKAARSRGWQGIEHSDYHKTVSALRALEVAA
jgi:hypothetical protein